MIPIIIANWKMNFTLEKALHLCQQLSKSNFTDSLIVASPALYLSYLAHSFQDINFCAQDVSRYASDGAYTGEYSAKMLKSCNINYCIVGHSERRTLFGEGDQIVNEKALNAIDSSITPIICIGETHEIRNNNNFKEFIISQLQNSIPIGAQDIIIAYEPIWSIGTSLIPSQPQLSEAFDIINSYIIESRVAKKVRLVYGGSVNQNNIEKILAIKDVSGVLVGAASINYESLIQIIDKVIKQ